MAIVVGVRFKRAGKIYYFDPGGFALKVADKVIVETARGVEFGEVVIAPRDVAEDDLVLPLKTVIRLGNEEDIKRVEDNLVKQKEAFEICSQKIREHGLPMKLIDVEYTFDNSKIIFYFTAEGRVDFRELVKNLAAIFRTRIELRQIGVRDEAKMVGGIGSCGRVLCCHSFLGDFEPVSIRMAKDQNLSLNPTKISGICGRLMCCLKYETDTYENQKEMLDSQSEADNLCEDCCCQLNNGENIVVLANQAEDNILNSEGHWLAAPEPMINDNNRTNSQSETDNDENQPTELANQANQQESSREKDRDTINQPDTLNQTERESCPAAENKPQETEGALTGQNRRDNRPRGNGGYAKEGFSHRLSLGRNKENEANPNKGVIEQKRRSNGRSQLEAQHKENGSSPANGQAKGNGRYRGNGQPHRHEQARSNGQRKANGNPRAVSTTEAVTVLPGPAAAAESRPNIKKNSVNNRGHNQNAGKPTFIGRRGDSRNRPGQPKKAPVANGNASSEPAKAAQAASNKARNTNSQPAGGRSLAHIPGDHRDRGQAGRSEG